MYLSTIATVCLLFTGCDGSPWNSPYPVADVQRPVLYGSFSERPNHLDPARSYSSNEYAFIAQIYEPPLQYHFLKRPYTLVPLAAEAMPEVSYIDKRGQQLPTDAPVEKIAFSEYLVRIQPGRKYQPHPMFARLKDGTLRYHDLTEKELDRVHTLTDLSERGSRELTAADYLYQVKRLAFPRFHCPIAGVMGEYIVGFKAYSDQLKQVEQQLQNELGEERPYVDLRDYEMEGLELVDNYSYKIRLKGKYPQFLYWMTMPFFAPMPWEADHFYAQPGLRVRNINLDWFPVGTGPFMLSENNPNLRMVLERNPNFHGERYPYDGEPEDYAAGLLDDADRVMPFIEKAIYSFEKETIPYWNKFLQGYYDTSVISSDSFDQAVLFDAQGEVGLADAMKKKGIHLMTAVQTSIVYFGFNMRDPVVGGGSESARLLRRAISIAVDYEEFISIFANGRGVVAQGPIPLGIFGAKSGKEGINRYVYGQVNGKTKRRSLNEAKQLMVQAGYPEGRDQKTGKSLVLYYDAVATGADDKARMNWWRKQFTKLGIQLIVRNTGYNRFQEKMRKGTGQLFSWGWNADYPDPENFLFLLYGPNAKADGEGENAANYTNPEFDELFMRMRNMDNSPRRLHIIDQMVEILRSDSPWLWGYYPKVFSLHHHWYLNVKQNLMVNNTLKYKRIEPEARTMQQSQWNRPVLWPVIILAVLFLLSLIPAWILFRRRERSHLQ
ncbi:MAG: ABC transporter substrate-binding protein [Candidatus Thiodiazotropha sp. (ex Lucinoma aequizonata)]|nr:ABC transporter substrate-binding protein [Candidatus Thiodiazotropha sp. (ex Lucinoma aequizonata)]MCU7888975.1 ABC transporter substrate-binding protein [Candidatus Thiodiazotropha sp. (ex Lucinoma aequizonata)]MCU7893672.1 ABC transporter substrate-binding protein [Candidatus Thiodiazotropha sp. (ex Lucinoma aequizonata)]MCU7898017.1 ABC transporter substrate-binding protein [Candidatus Thiodiazotropha sp. (ex Lucinoma aequizonata)]MCU7902607.1 ABC transporter substrate-binding protein [C